MEVKDFDVEWIELILEAKNNGLSKETIKRFFDNHDIQMEENNYDSTT